MRSVGMRVFSLPFAGGVVAAALIAAACGGSTESADSTPGDREASGLYRSTQLCVTNDTNTTQNISWTVSETNDQKTSIGSGDTTCGEGTFIAEDDVTVQIWQNSDRGEAWDADVEVRARNRSIGWPEVSVGTIDSTGAEARVYKRVCEIETSCVVTEFGRWHDSYEVGQTRTMTYTPWGEASPVTVTVTRTADTAWKEFRVTLNQA